MDGKEGFDMAKMAITALVVIVLVGIVIGLVYLAQSWVNSGTSKLGDQVTSIDKSAYASYDDKTVTGTDVATALKTYRDTDIAVFVSNKSTGGGYDPSTAISGSKKAFVYCAIPNGWDTTAKELSYSDDEGGFYFEGYEQDAGQIKHNTNFSPCSSKSSAGTYVNGSARFYSKLVTDKSTGEIGGIIFMQLK